MFCFNKQVALILLFLGLLLSLWITILNFNNNCFAFDVDLVWNANTEPDLEGYAVYQSKGAPGPPYELIDDILLDELVDPGHPQIKMGGLVEGERYYFVVTAYDTSNNESKFSNQVCVRIENATFAICTSSAYSGRGGGGSGGCFISSSAGRFRLD